MTLLPPVVKYECNENEEILLPLVMQCTMHTCDIATFGSVIWMQWKWRNATSLDNIV